MESRALKLLALEVSVPESISFSNQSGVADLISKKTESVPLTQSCKAQDKGKCAFLGQKPMLKMANI